MTCASLTTSVDRDRAVPTVAAAVGAQSVVALVLLARLLILGIPPASAGCCENPFGCVGTDDQLTCELEGGTFHPTPSLCDQTTDPPSCTVAPAPSPTPQPTATPRPSATAQPTPWPGLSDGRLNPDPGEYYAVWCSFDRAEVYREVPETELIRSVPIVQLIDLPVGATLGLGELTGLRTDEDTITISGFSGNQTPEPGSKAFSLAECIAANGGAPEPATDDPPPSGPYGVEPVGPFPSEQCFVLYSDDPELLIDCLNFAADQEGATGLEICWLWVFRFRVASRRIFGAVDRAAADGGHAGPSAEAAVSESDGGGPFLFLDLYLQLTRLRDQVFASTPGGRRATQLYYEHNAALLAAAIRNPTVLTAGRDALEAWAPIVDALVAVGPPRDSGVKGDAPAGDTAVSPAQVQAFEDFLEAVRAGGSPDLVLALERSVSLVDPATFVGLTPREVLARLDRLGCEAAATFSSLRCRLEELARYVDEHVERKLRHKFAKPIAHSLHHLSRAETAGDNEKRRRVSVRQVRRLLGRVDRRLDERKVVERVPEEVRRIIATEVAGLAPDVAKLRP